MVHKIRKRLAAILMGASALVLPTNLLAETAPVQAPKWRGSIDVLGFPGVEGAWQRTDLFMPLLQGPDTLTYFNLRSEWGDNAFEGFSTGIGIRHKVQDWIIGTYGFVDFRDTDHVPLRDGAVFNPQDDFAMIVRIPRLPGQ